MSPLGSDLGVQAEKSVKVRGASGPGSVRGLVARAWLAASVVSAAASAAAAEPLPDVSIVGSPTSRVTLDDDCMRALRDCCCPGWTHYAVFDALFLQRNAQIGDRPLVVNLDTGAAAISTQDLQPSIGNGVRVFYGSLVTDSFGWEIGYLGVYGMFGEATATGNQNLEMAPPLGPSIPALDFADSARATYLSTLSMAEFNLFRYDCRTECGPRCRENCHCVDWLAGFVWAGLDERAGLTTVCCDPPEPTRYAVRSSTNYFGPQVGMRGRRQWNRWAVEGFWKTAVCGTSAYQAADPILSEGDVVVRDAQSATTGGVAFIGSLNGTLVYRLTDVWGIRAGYNLIWLTNGALAPVQWDFTDTDSSGSRINDNGTLFLSGVNLGLEARW